MPIAITFTISTDTVTVNTVLTGAALTNPNPILYTLYYPGGSYLTQYNNTFAGLVNAEYAIKATLDDADGTVEEENQEFNITGSPVTTPATTFTIQGEPTSLQAVYNPVYLNVSKTGYRIGQLFFAEIWLVVGKDVTVAATTKTGAKLLRILRVNGNGDGTATFDLGPSLATVFRHDTATVPNTLVACQRDESAYQGYFFKTGFIQYDAQNREVKSYQHESAVKYVLRATLPLKAGGDMSSDYQYQFDGETVKFLTSIPNGAKRKPSEATLLSTFFARPDLGATTVGQLFVRADLSFNDGTTETGYYLGGYPVDAGGVYLFDVKPERLLAHPEYESIKSYAVYLNFFDDTFESTITQSREFKITDEIQQPLDVLFMNRLGAWDTLQFRREHQTEIKTKSNVFSNGFGARVYQVEADTSITINSCWLTKGEHQWLKDLMFTPGLYLNNEYHRQDNTSYKFDSQLGLFTIEVSVSPDYEENTIKL